jgi:hypothetical protein
MPRVFLSVVFLLAACAASNGTTDRSSTHAFTRAPVAAASPADDEATPASADEDRAQCSAAWQRFEAALAAATLGCASDDDCESFQTCHAVTRPNAAKLWKLHGRAQDQCRGQGGLSTEITCAARGPRCKQGHCSNS